jgi:prophage regulatory protein
MSIGHIAFEIFYSSCPQAASRRYGANSMRLIDYDNRKPVKGIPYSKVQLWRLERQKRFPKRISVGPQRYAWVESEIDAWIAERIRARDEAIRARDEAAA